YTEEEEALRAAVRDLLADHCDAPGVIARTESGAPHDVAAWKALAGTMGLAGLLIPEELGGQGATHREAAVVLEELGRAVAPVPYLTSAVVATEALLEYGDEELLGRLASATTSPFRCTWRWTRSTTSPARLRPSTINSIPYRPPRPA
ncbi:acyl-CoA dehydrogenase family protein, partial [Micromonospora chersina]